MTEVEQLREALQNCLGFLDTPITRRKIGLSPDAEWLEAARRLAKEPTGLSSLERRIAGMQPVTTNTPTGRAESKPEIQNIPNRDLPKVGDRVVWTRDPDPTCRLTGVKGTVVSVSQTSDFPHFHVEPDDWKGARIYETWNGVEPVTE